MANQSIKITVEDREVTITRIDDKDYISLTDMVGANQRSADVIKNWLRNRNTIEFLGTWERLYNPQFKVVEFDHLFNQAGLNRFTMSVKEWTQTTDAIGLVAKPGRGGGTYAHRDIAFEFGGFLSPAFKLLLIREFQRLKEEDYVRQQLKWDYQRFLTKVNYRLHTDTIRDYIIPRLQTRKNKQWLVYANEADLLNMAVFGQTAQQWREANPELAKKGNMRDAADVIELNVLANLESLNSVLIEQGASKEARFELLAKTAISQYSRLAEHEDLRKIE